MGKLEIIKIKGGDTTQPEETGDGGGHMTTIRHSEGILINFLSNSFPRLQHDLIHIAFFGFNSRKYGDLDGTRRGEQSARRPQIVRSSKDIGHDWNLRILGHIESTLLELLQLTCSRSCTFCEYNKGTT